jgi:hypothetical protein
MKKLYPRALFLSSALFFMLLTYWSEIGKVKFGHGFDDITYFLLCAILSLWSLILSIWRKPNRAPRSILSIVLVFIQISLVIYFLLLISIWRGPSYPWNGQFFMY